MRVACIQLSSVRDVERNLAAVKRLLTDAVSDGANLALLPENFTCMGGSEAEKRTVAECEECSAILNFLAEQAAHLGIAIVGGSLLLKSDGGKIRNACPVFDAKGNLLTIYDKIHLFDMDYQGGELSGVSLDRAR